MSLADLRKEYTRSVLSEAGVDPDPLRQFRAWLDQALAAGVHEPHAMTLATADADGRPSARVVLLRGLDERGFAFFTNYDSRKGRDLEANPFGALVFYWAALERQVRVEGRVAAPARPNPTPTSAAAPPTAGSGPGRRVRVRCSPTARPWRNRCASSSGASPATTSRARRTGGATG